MVAQVFWQGIKAILDYFWYSTEYYSTSEINWNHELRFETFLVTLLWSKFDGDRFKRSDFQKKKERVSLQTLQFYLVLVFHLSEFVSQLLKRWSQIRFVSPTFHHYFIPETQGCYEYLGMSLVALKWMLWISRYVIGGFEMVQPILDEQAFLVTNFLSFTTKEKRYITQL